MPDVEAESHGRGWVLLLAAFGVFGLWSGCNAVLLADLSRALGLSPGPLGAALFAGAAISVVTTFGYGGFLLGPILVGGVAELLGLRMALGVVALSGLAIFALSTRLE
jgi:hypothetical protein